jgi:hypothetical protein
MEASGTAVAGDGGQQGAEQGQQQGESGQDVGALATQLQSMQAGQEELRQFLMDQPWQQQGQQGEGEGEGEQQSEEPLDLSFLDPGDPTFDPDQLAQRLGGLINQTAEQRAQALIAPVVQQQAEMRRQNEARDLVAEFPEIAQPEVAQQVVQVARQLAEANGHPELADEPWMWRLTYMAGRAVDSANEEGSQEPGAATLEGGGGARPTGGQQGDAAEEYRQALKGAARGGRSALPF